MFVIPDDCIQKMIDLHGAGGLAWIDRLPALLATCEHRWKITIGSPSANLSYHYVASAVRSDSTPSESATGRAIHAGWVIHTHSAVGIRGV